MANIGDNLPLPEEGWRRYSCASGEIVGLNGLYSAYASGEYYNNQMIADTSSKKNGEILFYAITDKIRIMSYTSNGTGISFTPDMEIDIDGNKFSANLFLPTAYNRLVFEKKDLTYGVHKIKLSCKDKTKDRGVCLICVDVDKIGILVSPISIQLTEKTTLESMEIGDIISCRYAAPISGKVGYFSELGKCNADFINPQTSSATPDGKFYFIKVDDNKYIADRNVQHSISWSELNANKIIRGKHDGKSFIFGPNASNADYIKFPSATLKSLISKEITIRVRVYKADWGVSKKPPEIIFSSTNRGGFNISHNGVNKSIAFAIAINDRTYYSATYVIEDTKCGWLDIIATYDGTSIKLYINNDLKSVTEKAGTIFHTDSSIMCVGAEPGDNGAIEPSINSNLSNAKISEFAVFNKAYMPDEIPKVLDASEQSLVLYLHPKYCTKDNVYDVSRCRNVCTQTNIGYEYDTTSNIITVPTGGVAYNNVARVIPNMKGETYNGFTVLDNGSWSPELKAYNAFDIDSSLYYHCTSGQSAPYNITIHNEKGIIINNITFQNRLKETPSSPKVINIKASNVSDFSDSVTLVNTYNNANNTNASTWTIDFENDVAYKYYMLNITQAYVTGACNLNKIFARNKKSNDSDGFFITHQNQGGWPITNDWDTHIWKGDLGGKITPSDDLIWNYSKVASMCKEKSITNKAIDGNTPTVQSGHSIYVNRGFVDSYINDTSAKRINILYTNYTSISNGFRPILITGGDN